jgi:hypothetical protein
VCRWSGSCGPYFLAGSITTVLTTIRLSHQPLSLSLATKSEKLCAPANSENDRTEPFRIPFMLNNLQQLTQISARWHGGSSLEPSRSGLLPSGCFDRLGTASAATAAPRRGLAGHASSPRHGQNRARGSAGCVSFRFTGLLIPERRLECKKKIESITTPIGYAGPRRDGRPPVAVIPVSRGGLSTAPGRSQWVSPAESTALRHLICSGPARLNCL